ncbi:hypothetical protein [Bacillus sp. FSL K6-6540]|uniref:hypothetical protein n=1 Tax=Bacillus sp. FSL K6-6540 TaxID=2921512 RepID=UPI0030F84360
MEQIMFLGDYDKTDFLFALAKLLSYEKKVIIVEVSRQNRYQFAYPKVELTSDIYTYDSFDVWESIVDVEKVQSDLKESEYDYALIDIDDPVSLEKWPKQEKYYIFSSFENPVMQNNFKLLRSLMRDNKMDRLLPITKILKESQANIKEDYFNQCVDELPITWNETLYFYPEERDFSEKINNQFSNVFHLKKLSSGYKNLIMNLAMQIQNSTMKQIKSQWKHVVRGK